MMRLITCIALSGVCTVSTAQETKKPGLTAADIRNPQVLAKIRKIDPEFSWPVQAGVVVVRVEKESPASRLGFKTLDVIVRVGEEEITGLAAMKAVKPGWIDKDRAVLFRQTAGLKGWHQHMFVGAWPMPAELTPRSKDPVTLIKTIAKNIEFVGTTERVTDFGKGTKWTKRKYLAAEIKYDVRKTDSVIAPFHGDISFTPVLFITEPTDSEEEAKQAKVPRLSAPLAAKPRWWATLKFQDERWLVTDVGWRSGALGYRHSTLTDKRNPVEDWWKALGGK